MSVTIQDNYATNIDHGIRVEVPRGWRVLENNPLVDDDDTLIKLSPAGEKFPNIEVTYTGSVRDFSIDATRRIAMHSLDRRGYPLIDEEECVVSGVLSYKFVYRIKRPAWMFWDRRTIYGSKVSSIRDGREYLLQFACLHLSAMPIFDEFIESVVFLNNG